MLKDLTAAGETAAYKIANVVLDKCKLTQAQAELLGCKNLGDGAEPFYSSNFGLVNNKSRANAGVATTQSCGVPQENADKI